MSEPVETDPIVAVGDDGTLIEDASVTEEYALAFNEGYRQGLIVQANTSAGEVHAVYEFCKQLSVLLENAAQMNPMLAGLLAPKADGN